MNEIVKIHLQFLLVCWITMMIIFICVGTALNDEECATPMVRAEYLMPGRAIGCWLGEVP